MMWFWVVVLTALALFIYYSIKYGVGRRFSTLVGIIYGTAVVIVALVILIGGATLATPVFEDTPKLWARIFVKKCKCTIEVRKS